MARWAGSKQETPERRRKEEKERERETNKQTLGFYFSLYIIAANNTVKMRIEHESCTKVIIQQQSFFKRLTDKIRAGRWEGSKKPRSIKGAREMHPQKEKKMFNRRRDGPEREKERKNKKKQLESTKTEEIALRYFITTVQLTSDYKYNQQRNATKIHICQKNGPKMKK